ncbi:GNAT family N-acetyltransferase [Pseudofrankia inefficax]|uniref:GNAT family N-acetyltransferase n=1 Tax=Pseudofrankia inefficax (strain DSM 45817 / CECT 9037 / DDB 130130 / EuI1c) TaxID=298654 RepID=UPI00059D502A|nr:GNAT family N-acetyltransferase [Pseudofrankia inefficax]
MCAEKLLDVYDAQVRGSFPNRLPAGWLGERDGPLTRCLTINGGFAMLTEGAESLGAGALESLVDRTFAYYAVRGLGFEWKTFDHDRADLRPMLTARGAVAEAHEALVLGESAALAGTPVLPAGLTMRQVSDRADLERVAALASAVWDDDWSWLADDLENRLRGATEPVEIFVVEDGAQMVSTAWLVPLSGTRVAGLWGGSTLAAYRRRGLYRALVAHRAARAVALGYPLLQVDASDDSRPILRRLGLHVVGGTVPYVRAPAGTD